MPRGRPEIDPERCKGCGLCVAVCPEKILRLSEAFNRQGHHFSECFDPARCTACTFCAVMCPDCAIRVWRYVQTGAPVGGEGG
jgi:2-oxoglutarate ferredoxin oxidoreductase subunit delta